MPHFYFTPAAHELLLSWLEQANHAIAVRKAVVRESFDKARYNNLQNLRKKRKDSTSVLNKRTIQEALGKCQPRQRMWGISGVGYTRSAARNRSWEIGNHLQVLELVGTIAIADDIVHMEVTSTCLTLWFSGPRQAGTFVASCCSEAHPFGSASFRMLQPGANILLYVTTIPEFSRGKSKTFQPFNRAFSALYNALQLHSECAGLKRD
jgi:hypothetical protein